MTTQTTVWDSSLVTWESPFATWEGELSLATFTYPLARPELDFVEFNGAKPTQSVQGGGTRARVGSGRRARTWWG